MSAAGQVDWRGHYTELCHEGEAQGLKFNALGAYISQRMTDRELRAMLEEWAPFLNVYTRIPNDPPPKETQP